MSLGIVVVTYNSGEFIGECLNSCERLAGARIVVVDNASSDSTLTEVKKHTRVTLVANCNNAGFAAAANQGIGLLDEGSILLLNPDTILREGIEKLQAAVEEPGVGAAGGKLLGPDEREQSGFQVRGFPSPYTLALEVLGLNRVVPGNPINRRYRLPVRGNEPSDAEQPAGAFLMIRRSAWEAVGGFDEQFHPVWFEDVDFCKRLHTAGYRLRYIPTAIASHMGGHAVNNVAWESRQLYWYGSLLKYSAKHFTPGKRRLVGLALALACFPRAMAALLQRLSWRPLAVYSKIFALACRSLGTSRASIWGNSVSAPQPGP